MSEFESSFEDASARDTSFPNMKWNGRTYVIQTSCSETESEADQDTAAMPRQSTPQSKSESQSYLYLQVLYNIGNDVTSKKGKPKEINVCIMKRFLGTSAAITSAIKKHLQPSKLSAAFRNKGKLKLDKRW